MRIGKISKEYHISIDNLHYYIKYGLLVPPKPKGQYFFDETTLKDLEWILALKKLDFSLREIHSILSLKRISNFADVEDLEELKELFKSKRDLCQTEILKKQTVIKELDAHILKMDQAKTAEKSPTGVPIQALSLLCCPNCGASFSMQDVEMDQRFLYKGALSCKCGYHAKISSGILMTPNKNQNLQAWKFRKSTELPCL